MAALLFQIGDLQDNAFVRRVDLVGAGESVYGRTGIV
jgi:hypothetical protein